MTNTTFLSDSLSDNDEFNRKSFASSLAISLCLPKNSPGLVVGIEGAWGSGKSTLIRYITKKLPKGSKSPIIFEFNPWMTSGSEAVVEIFLLQLASVIGKSPASAGVQSGVKVGEKILQYVGLLKHLKHFRFLKYTPGFTLMGVAAEDIASAAEGVSQASEDAQKAGQEAIDSVKKMLPSLDLLQLKSEVIKELSNLNKPIVVIIDDIDRLTHGEIRTLFQAIKSVADFPRVTYLLAYDPNLVSSALDVEFGTGKGQAYLEKIVQVSYPIPSIMPWQLQAYIDRRLKDILTILNIDIQPYEKSLWIEMIGILTGVCKNPRDVLRLLNKLLVSLNSTKGEINLCDVVVMEAISLKYPSLRQAIYTHPQDFTGELWETAPITEQTDWTEYLELSKEENKSKWISYLPDTPLDLRITKKACHFLFPNKKQEMNLETRQEEMQDALRICLTTRLQRYFSFTAIEGVVDAKDMHNLLAHPHLLEAALEDSDFLNLLSWLITYTGSAQHIQYKEVFSVLIEKATNPSNTPLTRSQAKAFADLFLKLLSKADPTVREDHFMSLNDRLSLSVSHDLILSIAEDHGLGIHNYGPVQTPLIADINFCKSQISKWCDRVLQEMQTDSFLKESRFASIIWRCEQLGNHHKRVVAELKKICMNPLGLEVFLNQIATSRGVTSVDEFDIIWDPIELANLIDADPKLSINYSAYVSQLRGPQVTEYFQNKNCKKTE